MDTHNHDMPNHDMSLSATEAHDHGAIAHAAHPDDPAKMNEHSALLDLLPSSKATHRAIADGNWSDASTWEGGRIPGNDADVFIPEGIAVKYDVDPGSNPDLHYVRVNGELNFATDQDTAMKVDTLMTDAHSTLTIGTAANPMPANFTASIEIADNGPITDFRDIDPMQLSRGVITHGKVSIQGAEKASHLVMKAAEAGDTSIQVEGDASGWQVGDTIVVIGTKYLGEDANGQLKTQDEEVTIKAINGNTLTLSQGLAYDHAPPEGHEDLDIYVGNGSRNIKIFSENSGITNQDDVLSRGHVMVMHNPNAVIRNAEFTDLGRTNKSIAADDATKNNHGKVVSLDPTTADNVRGRYSLHLHRTGATDGSGLAIVEGNAVNGSPGWGIVQHDSHANVNDNFVYDIVGAGIVAETGNETGEWNRNLVTKVIGGNENTGAGEGVNDFGNEGHAFENVSRLLIQQDNVAANSLRGWHFREAQFQIDPDPDAMPLNFDPFAKHIDPTAPAILDFERNTAIGVQRGFDSNHRMNHLDNEVINDIEDFTAWEVYGNGINMYATNNYTFENLTVIGAENASRKVSGIQFSQGVDSLIVNNGHFENLDTVFTGNGFYAYDATKIHSESALIDVTSTNNRQWFENGGAPEIFSSKDINSSGVADFKPDKYADFSISPDNMYVHIAGTVTDGLGERKYGVFDMTHQIVNAENQEYGIEMELNTETLESHLQRYGVFEDASGLYTTLTLFMGDRVTGDNTPRTMKITLEGFDRSYIDGLVDVQKPLTHHTHLIEADSANTLYRQNMIDYNSSASTDGDDYIKAEKGDRTIDGGKGNDRIFTGNGKDRLDGGAGNDEIWGFDGDDIITGGEGADRLYGQLGSDRIYASVEDIIVNAGTHQEGIIGDTVVFEGRRSDYQILSYVGNVQFFVSDGKNQVLVQETEYLEFSQEKTRFRLKDRNNPFQFDGSVDEQYYFDYAESVGGGFKFAPTDAPAPDMGEMPDMGHGETPDGHDHGDTPDMGETPDMPDMPDMDETPDNDGHDHGETPDMGETPDGEMPDMPDMPDPGTDSPGDAPTPDDSNGSGVELLDDTGNLFNGTSDALVIDHQNTFEAEAGSLSFRFKADDTNGTQALVSKDSSGFDNGGHLTLMMNEDTLNLRAQTENKSFHIKGGKVSADTWNDVEISWGADGVKLSLNDTEVGRKEGFTNHLVNNLEPLVFGANQWRSGNQVADRLAHFFSGEIADATFTSGASGAGASSQDLHAGHGIDGMTPNAPGVPAGEKEESASGCCPVTGEAVCHCEKDDEHEREKQDADAGLEPVAEGVTASEATDAHDHGDMGDMGSGLTETSDTPSPIDTQSPLNPGDGFMGTDGGDRLSGGIDAEIFMAAAGNDTVRGNAGDDRIFGELGNDRLYGGSGNDFISGGAGNDFIHGGEGQDVLEGGAGQDTFRIGGQWGTHYWRGGDFALITDFTAGEDTIQLHGDASNFRLGAISEGNTSGVGIYMGANKNNLIAVVENASTEQLSLEDKSFSYT